MAGGRGAGTPCRVFGWCLPTGDHHDNCIREMFSNMTQQRYHCECPCHSEGER